jgi:hypothetical protein
MYAKSEVLLSTCKTLIHFGFPGDVLHRPLLREAYLIRITTERYVYMQDKISSKLSRAILLNFFHANMFCLGNALNHHVLD